uniref:Egg protein CP391S-like protein n=1 Tax=Schistosoma mansoni TaxID=6183 RepID=A0A913KPM2_SCHMA
MRYTILRSLWLSFHLIIIWPYRYFNCHEICENPNLLSYENIIFENDSYRYSLHYNYSMRIRLHQSQPAFTDSYQKIYTSYFVKPKFSFRFYDTLIHEVCIYYFGNIRLTRKRYDYFGGVENFAQNIQECETMVSNEEELLAVKRNFVITVNDTDVSAETTSVIQPNGKITLYFDNIPTEIEGIEWISKIDTKFKCEKNFTKHEIPVPAKWIKSGTLVEYEVIGKNCWNFNTSETCQRATTSNMTCIWCQKVNKCIESNDNDTHGLKVNDCRVENMITEAT